MVIVEVHLVAKTRYLGSLSWKEQLVGALQIAILSKRINNTPFSLVSASFVIG